MRAFAAAIFAGVMTCSTLSSAVASEPVVLINPFEVAPGREADCLAMWDAAAKYLANKPGFISTRLHRALRPDARFAYVNVAVWTSAAAFRDAVSDPAFGRLAQTDACTGSPALFAVAREQ